MFMKKLFLLISTLLLSVSLNAEVILPSIFSKNMVLQQGQKVKIWGKATPKSHVEIIFAGQRKAANVGEDGKWVAYLDSLEKNKTPQVLSVLENGKEVHAITNVLVGEVWVTGGQSNMEMSAGECSKQGFDDVLAKIDHTLFRSFQQDRFPHSATPLDTNKDGKWIIIGSVGSGGISAVSFFFGEELVRRLDSPVGVIQTAVGGTAMRSWLPMGAMEGNPAFASQLEDYKKRLAAYDYNKAYAEWQKAKADWEAKIEELKAAGKPLPNTPTGISRAPYPESPDTFRYPSGLYNAKVAPLAGFAAKGFLWYQGESDSSNPNFQQMFETIVDTWRKEWNSPEMPFLFVQLTSYDVKSNAWVNARRFQEAVTKSRKNVEMAVTIDLGEETEIHPKDKMQVAERLTLLALSNVYKVSKISPYGAFFKSVKFDKNSATLTFDTFGKTLTAKNEITGFEVLLEGSNWVGASAKLKGNEIVVTAPKDGKISGVRYLWLNWAKPLASVFVKAEGAKPPCPDLPLAPFSTNP